MAASIGDRFVFGRCEYGICFVRNEPCRVTDIWLCEQDVCFQRFFDTHSYPNDYDGTYLAMSISIRVYISVH